MFRGRKGGNRGKGTRGNRPRMERRYGFFRCKGCHKSWESSHVYCRPGTEIVMFQQDCKTCKTACFPYKTEKIRCSECGMIDCECSDDTLEEKRHVNRNKPHLAELCHKCRAGIRCQEAYEQCHC